MNAQENQSIASKVKKHYKVNDFVGNFRLIKHMSVGAFGSVFEAQNFNDGSYAAIKIVSSMDAQISSAKQ